LVNAICPGPVEGERIERVFADRAEQLGISHHVVRREYMKRMALGRLCEPEDISALVVYLAGPTGDNITGQAFDVAAGYGLRS